MHLSKVFMLYNDPSLVQNSFVFTANKGAVKLTSTSK